MFCKICGKPLMDNGKCLYCGHRQTDHKMAFATDETVPSNIEETEISTESIPDDIEKLYEQNLAYIPENELADIKKHPFLC